ncbi:hypothetical protein ABNX05_11610 [Lysinibacillus sp. M3]|uniref:Type II toxin-antitoxin system PemK/MazF family toxin n=1 Tax=Lysinibacillus zambalensis TaxID=3160866 RepID=A0ABV1MRX7_9BACI
MKAREIYRLNHSYEEGHGGKVRPVLIFILTTTPNEFLALKITSTPRPQNRVEITHWQEANLDHISYVQCDRLSPMMLDGEAELIGILEQSDYDKVVLKVNEFYPRLQKEYEKSLKRP